MKNILAALLIAATFGAANAQRAFTNAGQGAVACGKYLDVRAKQGDVDDVVGWVWGYISAYNQWSTFPPIDEVPASHTVLAYLDKHCRDNPLDRLVQGVILLVADLGGFRPPPSRKR